MSDNEETGSLSTRLTSLETSVAELTGAFQQFLTTQNKQSNTGGSHDNEDKQGEGQGLDDNNSNNNTGDSSSAAEPDATGSPYDIQREYGHIRDTLARVKIPACHRLNETSLAVNKKDRSTFTVLQRNARYLETGLKLLQVAQTDTNSSEDSEATQYFDQIAVILQAAISYNQQEYQALIVGSTFDQDTTKYFRVMQRSENCFSPQALGNLKLAAEIASVNRDRTERQPNSYQRNRGRGRGNFGQYRGHNQYNQFGRGRPPYYPPNTDHAE